MRAIGLSAPSTPGARAFLDAGRAPQGWFEADDSATLRLKFKQSYNFGQYPVAVVFDKADLLGANSLPLYSWLTRALANPWGVNRLVFNYEKVLATCQCHIADPLLAAVVFHCSIRSLLLASVH